MSSPFGGSGSEDPAHPASTGSEPPRLGPPAPQPYFGGYREQPFTQPGFAAPGYGPAQYRPQPYGPGYGHGHGYDYGPPPRRSTALRWILGGAATVLVVVIVVLTLVVTLSGPVQGSSTRSVAIPDADRRGVTDTIDLRGSGSVSAIQVSAAVSHPYTCDLVVTLRSPQGASALLSGGDQCDRNQPGLALALDSRRGELAPLVGQPVAGTWTLQIVDSVAIDRGTLDGWSITVER